MGEAGGTQTCLEAADDDAGTHGAHALYRASVKTSLARAARGSREAARRGSHRSREIISAVTIFRAARMRHAARLYYVAESHSPRVIMSNETCNLDVAVPRPR